MKSTNYFNTFMTVAGDCPVTAGTEPAGERSVASLQYRLLREKPFARTSDDLIFEIYALRNGVAEADRAAARTAFF